MFFQLPLTLFLLSRLTLAYVFVGCFDPRILPEQGGLVYDSYLDECRDLCHVNGTTWSYSWPDPDDHSDFPELRICQCGYAQPEGQFLVPDSLCDSPNVQVFYLPSPSDWSFSGCLYNLGRPENSVTSLVECLNSCDGLPIAYTYYIDSQIYCSCSVNIPDPDSLQTVCGLEDWFVYSETVLPSAFIARKIAKMRLLDGEDSRLCPGNQKACSVSQELSTAYECIDTQSELESCGGCLFSEVDFEGGKLKQSTDGVFIGIDCTNLDGVRRDGVTCEKGECVAFACEDDYYLNNGICKRI